MAELIVSTNLEFELPAGAKIYLLKQPEVTRERLGELSRRLDVDVSSGLGDVVESEYELAYQEVRGWNIRLFRKSGGWKSRHMSRWQAELSELEVRWAEHEVRNAYVSMLERLSVTEGSDVRIRQVERLRAGQLDRESLHRQERTIGARVIGRRVLDGLTVEGPGGVTVMCFDHELAVTAVEHLGREIDRPEADVTELRSPENVLNELRVRYQQDEGPIEITEMRLGYYEAGWYEAQLRLQPAYIVWLRHGSRGDRFSKRGVVPIAAAMNAVGELEPRSLREPPPIRREN